MSLTANVALVWDAIDSVGARGAMVEDVSAQAYHNAAAICAIVAAVGEDK